jgi:hypothetical protein
MIQTNNECPTLITGHCWNKLLREQMFHHRMWMITVNKNKGNRVEIVVRRALIKIRKEVGAYQVRKPEEDRIC